MAWVQKEVSTVSIQQWMVTSLVAITGSSCKSQKVSMVVASHMVLSSSLPRDLCISLLLYFPHSSWSREEFSLFEEAILLTPFKASPTRHGCHYWGTPNLSCGFYSDNIKDLLSFSTLLLISSEMSSFWLALIEWNIQSRKTNLL